MENFQSINITDSQKGLFKKILLQDNINLQKEIDDAFVIIDTNRDKMDNNNEVLKALEIGQSITNVNKENDFLHYPSKYDSAAQTKSWSQKVDDFFKQVRRPITGSEIVDILIKKDGITEAEQRKKARANIFSVLSVGVKNKKWASRKTGKESVYGLPEWFKENKEPLTNVSGSSELTEEQNKMEAVS